MSTGAVWGQKKALDPQDLELEAGPTVAAKN